MKEDDVMMAAVWGGRCRAARDVFNMPYDQSALPPETRDNRQ